MRLKAMAAAILLMSSGVVCAQAIQGKTESTKNYGSWEVRHVTDPTHNIFRATGYSSSNALVVNFTTPNCDGSVQIISAMKQAAEKNAPAVQLTVQARVDQNRVHTIPAEFAPIQMGDTIWFVTFSQEQNLPILIAEMKDGQVLRLAISVNGVDGTPSYYSYPLNGFLSATQSALASCRAAGNARPSPNRRGSELKPEREDGSSI